MYRHHCLMDRKNVSEILADNLHWIQENTELHSQEKIAQVAAVHQRTVGRWMGAASAPSIGNLEALARKLKVQVWQLLAPRFGRGLIYIDATLHPVPVQMPAESKREARAA
jgi:Helix-turn-helix